MRQIKIFSDPLWRKKELQDEVNTFLSSLEQDSIISVTCNAVPDRDDRAHLIYTIEYKQ